jgi:hypothetical protein
MDIPGSAEHDFGDINTWWINSLFQLQAGFSFAGHEVIYEQRGGGGDSELMRELSPCDV